MATRNPYGLGGWWLEEQEYAQLLAAAQAKEEAERERRMRWERAERLEQKWWNSAVELKAERDAEVKRAVEAMRERDGARDEVERRAQENAALQDRMHAAGDGLAGLAPVYQRIKAERDAATTALRAAEAKLADATRFCSGEFPCEASTSAASLERERNEEHNARRAAEAEVVGLDWQADLLAFHRACDQEIGERPAAITDARLLALRKSLITEECRELLDALDAGDVVEAADAMVDLCYVVIGTAVTMGIDLRPVWIEVHRTNMLKTTGPRRADGKVLKPEGWTPPDVARVLARQAALASSAPLAQAVVDRIAGEERERAAAVVFDRQFRETEALQWFHHKMVAAIRAQPNREP